MIIPDTELMAEKLGMIVLCHCGKRLQRSYFGRIPTWKHEEGDPYLCYGKEVDAMANNDPRVYQYAKARKGPLADEYDMEPQ